MAKSYLIELILRTVKQGTAGKDIAKEFDGVEKSAKKASLGLDSIGSVLAKGAAVMGTATAALFALKKAMDLGKEGAIVLQTAESFDLLIQKVGASSNLLDQLRDASRGTIDDMSLMSSTSTLLAGAQGELATQLASATPRLLEIAKAANKLNPSLGDTTYLYQSLATGIKRASPLILDNLGLTIKIGEANEKYAASLGKTVEQLTSEEQKQALLQETLRAGNVLIDQAGDSAESMTDAFARAEAQLKNATDQIKASLVPALAEVATQLSSVIILASGGMPDALIDTTGAAENTSKSLAQLAEDARKAKEEMTGDFLKGLSIGMGGFKSEVELTADELIKLGLASGATVSEIQKLADEIGVDIDLEDWERYIDTLNDVNRAAQLRVDAARATVEALGRQKDAEARLVEETGRYSDNATDAIEQTIVAAKEMERLAQIELDAIKSAEGLTTAHEDVKLGLRELVVNEEALNQALAESQLRGEDYALMLSTKVVQAAQDVADAEQERIDKLKEAGRELGLTDEQLTQYVDTLGYTESGLKAVADDLNITGEEFDGLAEKTGLSREALERLHEEFGMGEDAILDYVARLKDAQRAYENLAGVMAGGLIGLRDLGQTEADSLQEYEDALAELNRKSRDVYGEVKLNFEKSLPDATTVKDRMGMQEDAWDEWGLRFQDIINQGIASPYASMLDELGLAKPPDTGWKEWAAELKEGFYAGDLSALINTDAQAWQDYAATMKAAQADATAAYNAEVAQRKTAIAEETAALKAARDEQLAAEKEARQQATLELSLQIAEQTGILEQWSQQRFGPDFSGVADTAEEVLGLIESGMVTIDGDLAALIGNTAAGIQTALDMTGQAAETNKTKLDEILSPEWAAQQQEKLKTALDLESALPPEDIEAMKSSVQTGVEEAVPEGPFAELGINFSEIVAGIGTDVDTMTGDFSMLFTDIETGSGTTSDQMTSDFETAAGDMAAAMSDLEGEAVDDLGNIAEAIEPIIDKMGDAKQGAKDVKSATHQWKVEVDKLTEAYWDLYEAMVAAGALGASPPKAETDAYAIADAYVHLARVIGTDLGQALMGVSSLSSEALKEIQVPGWITNLETLSGMGRTLGGIGGFYGGFLQENIDERQDSIDRLADEIGRIDWMLARPERYGADVLNKALAERVMLNEQLLALQKEQYKEQEALGHLSAQEAHLANLEQQVKLLDLIAKYGLDAKEILGNMKLGVDVDPLEMVEVLQKAMQQIVIGQLVNLQAQGFQHGGQFRVAGSGGIDTVPVMFMATPGETVTITPTNALPPPQADIPNARGQPLPGQPVHNYNLTIHSNAPAESALSDFHTMKVLAGV